MRAKASASSATPRKRAGFLDIHQGTQAASREGGHRVESTVEQELLPLGSPDVACNVGGDSRLVESIGQLLDPLLLSRTVGSQEDLTPGLVPDHPGTGNFRADVDHPAGTRSDPKACASLSSFLTPL